MTYNIIGLDECAAMLGVSKATVLRKHKESAIAVLSCGPIWDFDQFKYPGCIVKLPHGGFVGFKEAAAVMGVSRQAISDYVKHARNAKQSNRRYFPLPVAEPSCGPIWLRSDVEAFKAYVEEERINDVAARKRKQRKVVCAE